MAEWDDENFDVDAGVTKAVRGDKWEGEDEDEDVKDSWDVESEEEKNPDEDESAVKAVQVKKKKSIKEKIKEKEEKKQKELEEKKAREEEEKRRFEEMTPEEQAAERLRQQKLVEDADFELAKEAFGVPSEELGQSTIDSMNPLTREEFDEYGRLLKDKLCQFEKSPHYVSFLDNLFRDCCVGLDADDVKRLGSTLTVLSSEKAKASKAKGKTKKKKGAAIKTVKKDDLEDYSTYADDYDDFM